MRVQTVFLSTIIMIVSVLEVRSQDVPFLWGHHWGVGARAVGMGGAYTGIADDYSAMYYNPAGLGQLENLEVFGSFSHFSVKDRATWVDERTESSSFTKLNSIGISVPLPTYRGSLVLGFGYHRVRDFDKTLFVQQFISTPGDSVTWRYDELEEGDLSNVSFGGSIEMGPNVFLGLAVNFWVGSNDYTWRFTETDEPYDIYTFSEYTSTDHFHTKLSGVNFTLGTLFRLNKVFRFGGTLVTPVSLRGKEDWDYTEVTSWDDGFRSTDSTDFGFWEYKVQSPWIFRLGGAINPGPLLVSADVEFKNYSRVKYTSYPPEGGYTMADVNFDIKQNLQNTMNWHVGGEFTLPTTGARIRAGYAVYPSPWKGAPSGQDRKILSLGGGYTFQEQFDLNVCYVSTSWDGIAGDPIRQEKVEVSQLLITLSYRRQLSDLIKLD
jgi:long-subunit fatty acid transport protein